VFASFALHGLLGLQDIAWPLRLLLAACCVTTIVPRLELQLAAALVGSAVLTVLYIRAPRLKESI
jgi:hypothetical protein